MKKLKQIIATLGVAVMITLGLSITASPASAASDCKTVTTTLKDRPDNGGHGIWATDQITRTIEVCHVVPQVTRSIVVDAWLYSAKVTDTGTFTTHAGANLSPHNGAALNGGVKGYVDGGFTAEFTAPHDWGYWQGAKFDGKTLTGTPSNDSNCNTASSDVNPPTSCAVKALWLDGFKGDSIGNDWHWKYRTCDRDWDKALEKMTDAAANGKDEFSGEITGKPCPSPSTSPSASASPSASRSGGQGGGVVAQTTTNQAVQEGLPVTGDRTAAYAAGGLFLVVVGIGAFLAARKRRTKFES